MQNVPFASILIAARKRSGMNVQELAERVGVHRQTIAGYEHGVRYPDVNILRRIAYALNVDCNYLCDYDFNFDSTLPMKEIGDKIDCLINELRAFKSSLDNQSHQ